VVGVGMAPVASGATLRLARRLPTGRAIHRAGEALRIAERLREEHPVAMDREPVVAEAAGHLRREGRGKVGKHAGLRKHREAGVVGDRARTPKLPFRLPADPPVSRRALERAALPARQCHPTASPDRNVAQTARGQPTEPEMMVPVHRRVPVRTLPRCRQPDLDLRKGEIGRRTARRRLDGTGRRHEPRIARAERELRRKVGDAPPTDRAPHLVHSS